MTKATMNPNLTAAAALDEQQLDQAVGGSIVMPDVVVHQKGVVMHEIDARKGGQEQQDPY